VSIYAYDVENRLTAITAGAETIVYINRLTSADYNDGKFYHYFHDAVGNRITQQTHLVNNIYVYDDANRLSQSGVHYTLDLNAGLTQVLSDGTNAYLYGLGRLSENEGGVNEYYLGDALGSVRQLANNNGEITLSKSYEPYGDALQSLGTGVTDYGFTGETTDANGLIYLRARYYSPEQGRFVNRDTWAGDVNIPASLNSFNYAQSNPVMNTDPSGLCSITDTACLKISHKLKIYYGWNVVGTWQLHEVNLFLDAADQIASYFDYHGGNGAGRMRALSPIYLTHATNFWITLGAHHVQSRSIILIPVIYRDNIIHEFGHIIDNVIGSTRLASLLGGGPSDDMARHLGVDPSLCSLRFLCPKYEQMLINAGSELPAYGYAYNGPSEDFAETFEKIVVSDSIIHSKNPIRVAWMNQFIEGYKLYRDLFFDPLPIPTPNCAPPEVFITPYPNVVVVPTS